MDKMKGTSRRLWMSDDDMKLLASISDATNLGQTELLTQILHAGLRSISEDGNRITFPLRFHAVPTEAPRGRQPRESYLNDPKA